MQLLQREGAYLYKSLKIQLLKSFREHAKLKHVVPIIVQKTGLRGRPKKIVEPVWLADAVSSHRKITLQKLADALGMHRNTLRNYLKLYGVYGRYSSISDSDLDNSNGLNHRRGSDILLDFYALMVSKSRGNVFASPSFASTDSAKSFENTP